MAWVGRSFWFGQLRLPGDSSLSEKPASHLLGSDWISRRQKNNIMFPQIT